MCARQRSNFLLLRQKKVTKEKATLVSVTPAAPGQPAVLDLDGVCANSPCGLRHAQPFFRPGLRSSAQPQGRVNTTARPHKDAPWRVLVEFGIGSPCPYRRVRRRVAQDGAEQEAQMSEPAGRVSALPALAEQRSVPCAQCRDDAPGSPSLCLLSLGEARESESPAGARPGKAAPAKTQRSKEKARTRRAFQRASTTLKCCP